MKWTKPLATLLMTIGIIFFMAMAFQVMTWKYAIFAGVACLMLASMVRRMGRP